MKQSNVVTNIEDMRRTQLIKKTADTMHKLLKLVRTGGASDKEVFDELAKLLKLEGQDGSR